MAYATPSDYKDWLHDQSATITQRELDRAQVVIDEITIGVEYDDSEHVASALMRATCAQAAWFDETGDPSGARAVLGGAQIGSLRLGSTGTSGQGGTSGDAVRYAREAIGILHIAGLLKRTVEYS